MPAPKFELGQLLVTPAALEALNKTGTNAMDFIMRHCCGDWGTVCPEDAQLNDQAVTEGSRVFSAYVLRDGTKIWVITEAKADDGHRASTCVLLPDDY